MYELEFEIIGKMVPIIVLADKEEFSRFQRNAGSSNLVYFSNVIINMRNVTNVNFKEKGEQEDDKRIICKTIDQRR